MPTAPALAGDLPDDAARPPGIAGGGMGSGALASALTSDRLLLFALSIGVMTIVASAPQLLGDGDTLWHLATGQWILSHGAVPHVDPFSYTAAGRAWTAQEWLSEVAMAETWRTLGWAGLQLLFGVAMAATAWILGSELQRKLPTLSWVAALAMALACTAQSWLARPHLLVLPILALWMVQLLRAREAGRTPPLWLLALVMLWANLHASFLIGIALIAPVAAEAVLDAGENRWRAARGWGLFLLGAVAASLITPQNVEGLIYPIRVSSMRTLQDIVEWKSADFTKLSPFEVSLLTAIFVLVYRRVRLPLIRLLALIGLLHLGLHEVRHQLVLAVVGVLLIAAPLGESLKESGPSLGLPALRPRARGVAFALLILAGAGLLAARIWIPSRLAEGPNHPIAAFAHVPAPLHGQPVLNEYGMGGYLILNGVRPFIDGRADMYGDDFFDAYVQATRPDRGKLIALLAKHRVRWTILDPRNGAVQVLDGLPDWKRIYADKQAVVHVRTGA